MPANSSNRSVSKLQIIWLLLGVFALVPVFMAFNSLQNYREIERLTTRSSALTNSLILFEREIGYGGFIHHFKNAVLRPKEKKYQEYARQSFENLTDVLDVLEEEIQTADMDLKFDAVRSTFSNYRTMLDKLQKLPDDYDISAKDSLVHVNDADAVRELSINVSGLINKSQQLLKNVQERFFWSKSLLFATFSALMIGAILVVMKQREQVLLQRLETADIRRHAQEIELANNDLRAFAYAVSHDLKAPLNTTHMLLKELGDHHGGPLDDDGRELLGLANGSVDRLRTLIDELLRYTRVIGQELVHEPVNLNDLVRDVVKDLEADIHEAGAAVSIGELPVIDGHALQIRTLLQNLISNAVKFRRPDVPCVISIESPPQKDEKFISIVVTDNGIGIPKDGQERIFGMFKRLHGHNQVPGIGLGLPLCRRVAINHGGDIAVSSSPPEPGSVFTVKLLRRQNGRDA